jgi:tRNA-splicing ligase RtcB
VNLLEDEQGRVWVGIHFGSRGFGHNTASGFLALAKGKHFGERAVEGEMDSPPVLFEVGSELGDSYIAAMELAGEYAYAGRDVVVEKVLEILGAEAEHEVHNTHNFAWREEHFGRTYWVIRKGCTPARPGQEGFVGGSMGDDSVILEGVESAENEQALFSTVHGAGRVMSRSQAAGRVRLQTVHACSVRDCDSPSARSAWRWPAGMCSIRTRTEAARAALGRSRGRAACGRRSRSRAARTPSAAR